jgi:hypothetical protein
MNNFKTLNFSNELGTTTIIELDNDTVGCIESKEGRFLISIDSLTGNFDTLEGAKNDVAGYLTELHGDDLKVTNN